MEQLERAESPYRFRIPDDLLPKLETLRTRQRKWRDVIDAENVVHLYLGLGPAWFLTLDGRILVDNYEWDGTGAYEVTDPKEACLCVVIGAMILDCPELLRILPERPADAIDCPKCGGSGWLIRSPDGRRGVACGEVCGGLGWIPRS